MKPKRMNRPVFISIVMVLSTLVVAVGGYAAALITGSILTDEDQLNFAETSTVVDEEGEVLARLFFEDRTNISIDEIPEHVQQSFIAVEDHRFHEHQGVDFIAIGRALYRDILAGAAVEGGSTITQQLAKNVYLENDKTLLRKTKEVLISMNLERNFSKDTLLEMYLNQIYFGHGVYGIERASELYFDKSAKDLTIAEGALLAAIPKAPYHYSPASDIERAEKRRGTVLALMERHGFINEETMTGAMNTPISSDVHTEPEMDASFYTYVDMMIQEGIEKHGISEQQFFTGGYTIEVPIHHELQNTAYSAMENNEHFPDESTGVQAAYVMLDNKTGAVKAVQGGRDYVRKGLNRVNIPRQPGSAFKPISVYAPALESGQYKPYSLLKDELLEYGDYEPSNVNDVYQGSITMRDAIIQSTNTSAVWLLNELGTAKGIEWANEAVPEFQDDGLSVALGGMSEGVSPLHMASAYTAFANGGIKSEPYFINSVKASNGESIVEAKVDQSQLLSEQNAWYMTRMLESAVKEGTAQPGNTDHALAGKTGTTNFEGVDGGNRDAWFVGYTPQYTGAMWMGYDSTTEEQYLQGGSAYPTQLFKSILNTVPVTEQGVAFHKPEGVSELESPVQFAEIEDLDAALTLQGEGFLNVKLNWTAAEDDRLVYNIYEVKDGEASKVGEVEGEGSYTVNRANMFSLGDYMVVPFNPQTGQEGEPSNVADVSVMSIF
ncbi:PBP1A family penicillin-binding protein [Geomicrobium sp. JSM 1781026]|uniref:transglycosylase domain-containing protein n=1 Tax=Geomicrobium sp. JSM 1781026 TaxID=3344580 RepID=UPI0035C157D1